MNSKFSTFILLVSFLSINCNTLEDRQPIKEANLNNNISGKVFQIGPSLDTLNNRAYGECDCCTSEIAFYDDSSFLIIQPCLYSSGYFNGKYIINGDSIILTTNRLFVNEEEDPMQLENNNSKVTLTIDTLKPTNFKLVRSIINGKEFYKTDIDSSSFATLDTLGAKELINMVKSQNDSVLLILKIK